VTTQRIWIACILLEIAALAALSSAGSSVPATPPAPVAAAGEEARAAPVPIEAPGLENTYRVTPGLYRGAQPTREGMTSLHEMGIKTIVNLRKLHSDRDEMGSLPFEYVHIGMTPIHPEDEDIVRFLRVVSDQDRAPVFVHCQYGSDRTGMMCALYRIFVCGWPKEDAIEEMTEGPFDYHAVWKNLISYIREMDVARMREAIR
jgi:tyrosine-protein phosphatase SIW14